MIRPQAARRAALRHWAQRWPAARRPQCAVKWCNIYISRLCYDASVRLSVRLSVTEVHWRIITNLGFKLRSHFTAYCRAAGGRRAQWRRAARRAACGRIISRHASQCSTLLFLYLLCCFLVWLVWMKTESAFYYSVSCGVVTKRSVTNRPKCCLLPWLACTLSALLRTSGFVDDTFSRNGFYGVGS